jgi:hypothetical protein
MAGNLNDSSRKLLDLSPSDTTNLNDSKETHLTEINENTAQKRKKFTVIKHKTESICLTPTEPNPNFKNDFAKQTSVLTTGTVSSEDASDLLLKENEDLFLDDVMQSLTVAANNNRYQEGQDTITSLKNSVFVKQLASMRRRASLKSNKSNQTTVFDSTSANSLNTDAQPQPSGPETPTSTISKANAKTGLFFKSQESIRSSKRSSTRDLRSYQKPAGKSPSTESRNKVLSSAQKIHLRSASESLSNNFPSQQNLQVRI